MLAAGPGEAERGPWHDERHHCASGGDGLAPARQLMDVSQLLRLYQARGWGALPAEDLLLYLKRQEHGRYQPGVGGSDGRSLDPWETAQAGEGGLGAVHREASDRKSTRLNSSHRSLSRMPSSA